MMLISPMTRAESPGYATPLVEMISADREAAPHWVTQHFEDIARAILSRVRAYIEDAAVFAAA